MAVEVRVEIATGSWLRPHRAVTVHPSWKAALKYVKEHPRPKGPVRVTISSR